MGDMSVPCEIGGQLCRTMRLVVGWTGPWKADIDTDYDDDKGLLSAGSSVKIQLGDYSLTGTITRADRWAGRASYVVVAGAASWASLVGPKAYHSDGEGIRLAEVAQWLADTTGETIEVDSDLQSSTATDWQVPYTEAGAALEAIWPASAWWVDLDGTTKVGARPERDAGGSVESVEYDSARAVAVVRSDDIRDLWPGSYVSDERAPARLMWRDCIIHWDSQGTWAEASTVEGTTSRIVGALRRLTAPKQRHFWGLYRYRVVEMKGNRVSVQRVSAEAPDLPDMEPVSAVPGVAGASSDLVGGSTIYVQFADGDPRFPCVTGYTPPDQDAGHVPDSTTLDATNELDLGPSVSLVVISTGAAYAARADRVDQRFAALESFVGSHIHSGGTISGKTGGPDGSAPSGASTAADRVKIT